MKGLTPTVTSVSECSDPKLESMRAAQMSPSPSSSLLSSLGQAWTSCWHGIGSALTCGGVCFSAHGHGDDDDDDDNDDDDDEWIRDRKKYIHNPTHAAASFYATSTPKRMKPEGEIELDETR